MEAAVEEERAGGRGLAILLALAALFAAILGARASLLSGNASGYWQQAVRQEIKAAAAAVEDVRFVYGDEAPQAFQAIEASIRAEEYRAAAAQRSGVARSVLLAAASAQDQLRDVIVGTSDIAKDLRYRRDDGTYDLGLRLKDVRNKNTDLVTIHPEDPQAAGDRAARQAFNETAATIPVALTFLFGALAQGFRSRRRVLLSLGTVALLAGVAAAAFVELTA
jgi:hypothetical protein